MSRELGNWLRYYRDLGFTHLYRPEAPGGAAFQPAHAHPADESQAEPNSHGSGLEARTPNPVNLFAAISQRESLEAIRDDLGADCRRCKLWKGRQTIVFGSGNPKAHIVFVGEGPGADEDAQGLPFVGRAGQLLTEMIEKGMKIPRPEVYICNIVKCRPPENRKPEKDEVAACRQFVERQVDTIQPRVICALGATAAETLLGTRQSMASLRGQRFEFHGLPLIVTYHPAFLLRDPTKKRDAWADLKLVLSHLQ